LAGKLLQEETEETERKGTFFCGLPCLPPFALFAPVQIFWLRLAALRLCVFALIRVQAANGESKNLTEANGANGEGILLKMHNWGLSLRVANPQYRHRPLAAQASASQMPRVELRCAQAVSHFKRRRAIPWLMANDLVFKRLRQGSSGDALRLKRCG
jgi:hypothetical protein